jgi:hypothetical protein
MKKLLAIILFVLSMSAYAQGQPGWNWQAWAGGSYFRTTTAAINWENLTYVASNYHNYLDGYVKWPGATGVNTTISFAIGYDDSHQLNVNGVTVASGPCCQTHYGSYTAKGGDIVKLEFWSNNFGGGWYTAFVKWDPQGDGTYELVTDASIATTATYWPPALAGGASAAAFNPNPVNVAKLNTFVARPTADSKVNVEQIGNFNKLTVRQSGTKNNYAEYYALGSNNNSTITQTGTATTTANWAGVGITGNNNSVTLTQTSTGGSKSAFVSITENNNTLNLEQKDSGSHYAEINLRGGNKTVGITQQGSAGHRAKVELSGQPINLNLTQSGSTQQFYSITHTCATVGGCAAITVTQGQ